MPNAKTADGPSTSRGGDRREGGGRDEHGADGSADRPREIFSVDDPYTAFFTLIALMLGLFRAVSQRCTC
jgi:hypothetical protein